MRPAALGHGMALRHVVIALLVGSLALPVGFADHTPPCADVTDAGATALALPTGDTLYVGSNGGVYQEGNLMPGLQTASCGDENGRHAPADDKLL